MATSNDMVGQLGWASRSSDLDKDIIVKTGHRDADRHLKGLRLLSWTEQRCDQNTAVVDVYEVNLFQNGH